MRIPWARVLFLAPALLLAGCRHISFQQKVGTDAYILEEEVKAFFNEVKTAFAGGNAQALASLFSSSITHPMTQAQILSWGQKFFAENKSARFVVEKLSLDSLGPLQATVTMAYRVETLDGKGNFGGVERDSLVKKGGRWYISAWDKTGD
ncbi:MAG: hypothetical protein HY921_05160 [Elusimicrobia bacterium]|nr:hypothetical protein [Elusimicrobiota bacterium]